MARSPAARLPRPLVAGSPRRRRRASPALARSRALRSSLGVLAECPAALARLLGRGLSPLYRRRRLRIALLVSLLSLALLGGGWIALRHSSLVSVKQVGVSGVHGPEARAIEAALTVAARQMSTLDVKLGALRTAVAPFPVVRELHASASLPHSLHISVNEQLPVVALTVGGARSAVAADGVVLGPALLSGSEPALAGSYQPPPGAQLRDPSLLAALSVMGAAPAPLLHAATRVFTGPQGLTVAMRNGLQAYFGDATRPHAKWFALARVLADASSAGASYVDVRLPERPAAGFPAGTAPAAATGTAGSGTSAAAAGSAERTTPSEAMIAALSAGLPHASGGAPNSVGREAASPGAAGTPTAPPASETGSSSSGETPTSTSESPAGAAPPTVEKH